MAKKEILNNDALTVRVNSDPVLDMAEQAIEATEQALDILENQVDRVVTVTKNNPFLIAGALIVGLGVGGFVAYKVASKRAELKYEKILSEEIAAAKAYHKRFAKVEEFESPESAVEALVPENVAEAIQSYQGKDKAVPYNTPEKIVDPRPPVKVVVEEAVIQQNVFTNANPLDWDEEQYRLEIADREVNPDQPYVISFEEFQENTDTNDQATLVYYEGDDMLCDEREQPIDNTEYVVGDDNLTRFGHGSKDVNVVYVRNEKMGSDFEIVRNKGSYHKEVLGLDTPDSLKHSQRRPNRRQWRADE